MTASTLYICYFGVDQPLVQTQVLPYLRELRKDGIRISLLTFEPEPNPAEIVRVKESLAREGIDWHWLRYHKRLSVVATAWDILCGAVFIRRFIARERPDILHGRVHVPTLMAFLGRIMSRKKPRILFDIRGFLPEEYADAGLWPENGFIFRTAKRVEKRLLRDSDAFVVLTEKARDVLFPESAADGYDRSGRPVEVIPCCVDLDKRFAAEPADERARARADLGLEDRFVLVHTGALGGLYLTKEIVDLLAAVREVYRSVYAMFLTQSDPNIVVPLLKEQGFKGEDYFVGRVAPDDVPQYLYAADAGISFVKASYATLSRSPTKIPEYLACGLPIIANKGVGDVDSLIVDDEVGVLVGDFNPESYNRAIGELRELIRRHPGLSRRLLDCARRRFDLVDVGGKRYRRLYGRLAVKEAD